MRLLLDEMYTPAIAVELRARGREVTVHESADPPLVTQAGPSPAGASTLPSGFRDSVVLSGLTNPTVLQFAPSPGPFAGGARYNAYGPFLKRRFGCRVYKVIVDAGFTCPNRDGTVAVGGCTYCNNDSFRPGAVSRPVPERTVSEPNAVRPRARPLAFPV